MTRRPRRERGGGLLDQLAQRRGDAGQTLALGQLAGVGTRDDHDVDGRREALRVLRERLAQEALDEVALDRAAHAARDAQADPRLGRVLRLLVRGRGAREEVQDQVAVAERATAPEDAVEVGTAGQATRFDRGAAGRGRAWP